jgi:hypothetical protein
MMMIMRRCIDKVVMEEMVEWENVVTCDHSYNKRCHTSQITTFNAAQVVYTVATRRRTPYSLRHR